ncbi:hypothetical protein FIE12Z_10305 [Fusarium flagelliforme]|uniref:Rhodopsin domain-containing protein n=1 Tax=Fusarium flagelliforme TaxID=2675880 RepID=A0A395MEC0_9HYPO|nr:hypothetical protein FIE12Z_10305 [Fusarium flagelliforme]
MNVSNGLSPVTPDDHAGKLWIVTVLSLIYALHVAGARAFIKRHMFGLDDALYGVATLLHIAQSIAIFVGLSHGLGKKNSITTPQQWAISSRCTVAATIFFITTLTLAKCSVLALIRRIIASKPGKSEIFCTALLVFTVLWGIGSCISFLVDCDVNGLLDASNPCSHQKERWIAIAVLDITSEILTLALIFQLVGSVNLACNRRWQVIVAFSFRLPLIAMSAVHVRALDFPSTDEPQFRITKALMIQQIMVAWSLISATMPNLKNFMKSFRFNIGMNFGVDTSAVSTPESIALQTFGGSTPNSPSPAGTVSSNGRPYRWRPDIISHLTTVTRGSDRSSLDDITEEEEVSRGGSQEMIINKEVTWNVTYEDTRG